MRRTRFTIFSGAVLIGVLSAVNAKEVTLPVVDGMTLQLGNYVQQVKIRAKSLGPGACAVTFELGGKSANFLSPPLKWSPWTDVGPAFLGPSTQKLSFSVGCDTGALAEVKYST